MRCMILAEWTMNLIVFSSSHPRVDACAWNERAFKVVDSCLDHFFGDRPEAFGNAVARFFVALNRITRGVPGLTRRTLDWTKGVDMIQKYFRNITDFVRSTFHADFTKKGGHAEL